MTDANGGMVLMNRPAKALYRALSQRRLKRAIPEGVRALARAAAEWTGPEPVYANAAGSRLRFVAYTGGLLGESPHVVVTVADSRSTMVDLPARYGLTVRECEIARLIAGQLSNQEIAEELGISVHTVRNHVRRVLAKVGVQSRRRVRNALQENEPK